MVTSTSPVCTTLKAWSLDVVARAPLRVLHPELEESERSLGGAARFWADCYAQVAPPADATGCAGLYASYDGEGGGSGGGWSSARRLMSGDVVGRRGGAPCS